MARRFTQPTHGNCARIGSPVNSAKNLQRKLSRQRRAAKAVRRRTGRRRWTGVQLMAAAYEVDEDRADDLWSEHGRAGPPEDPAWYRPPCPMCRGLPVQDCASCGGSGESVITMWTGG